MVSNSIYIKSLLVLFRELEYTNNIKDKIECLEYFKFPNLLKRILDWCYNSTVNINIEYIKPKSKKFNDSRLRLLIKTLDHLSRKDLRKIEATPIIKKIVKKSTRREEVLYLRIINKKLNLGLSKSIIDKCFPGLIIYPTKFMFGIQYNVDMKLDFPVYVEPVIKGTRVKLIAYPNKSIKAYSEELKEYTSELKSYLDVLSKIARKIGKIVEVDSILRIDYEEGKPVLTDILLFDFIIIGKNLPLSKRKNHVIKYIAKLKQLGITPINVIPCIEVNSYQDINNCYKTMLKKNINGIFIKDPKSPYTFKHDTFWLWYSNIKRTKGEIIQIINGTGKNKYTCVCIIIKAEGRTINITDFSDKIEPKILWEKRNVVIGNECNIELHKKARLISYRR